MTNGQKHLFCFGLGYSARLLAQQVLDEGWTVTGTTRSEEKREAIRGLGAQAIFFDRGRPVPARAFSGVTHVVSSVPPDDNGDPVADLHGKDLAGLQTLEWAALLSTTGVYGDRDGGTVDEESELGATNRRGELRVIAERAWLALHEAHGFPAHIFRLAGIYGPGRSPLTRAAQGKASRIVKPGLVLGRIHQEDIVGALRASMAKPNPGRIYNLADDEPMPPQDITAYACTLLGIDSPPEIPYQEAEMPPRMREFYSDCKRVSNLRLKQELRYQLKYPNYRAGLDALNAA
ncbi:MAG TPA: SDR family oxidoreductase [Alphaproteobacteria bacterium]|nr:SDR family oxidoreductase [Alphaproteobacteria bacterium]